MPLGGLIPYGPESGDIRRKLQQQMLLQKLLGGSTVKAAPLFGTGRTNRLAPDRSPAFIDFVSQFATRPRFNRVGGGGSLPRSFDMPTLPARLPRGATPGINPNGGDGRIGLPAGGVGGRTRLPRIRARVRGHRPMLRRPAVRTSAPVVRSPVRRHAPVSRPAPRRATGGLRARSGRILVHGRPGQTRRYNPVLRYPPIREQRMGIRRAESAGGGRPRASRVRYTGGIPMESRTSLV